MLAPVLNDTWGFALGYTVLDSEELEDLFLFKGQFGFQWSEEPHKWHDPLFLFSWGKDGVNLFGAPLLGLPLGVPPCCLSLFDLQSAVEWLLELGWFLQYNFLPWFEQLKIGQFTVMLST